MAFTRKIYAGAATVTTITAGVTSTATAFTVDDSTGWPSGGEFTVVVDFDTASEEKFLANGRTGNTITLATSADRGIDGTSAQAHNAGAKICPTLTAGDLDEANYAVVNTVGRITAKGGLLAGTSNAALGQLALGTNGQMLQVDTSTTTGLKYGALPDGSITTSAKFAAGVVNTAALGADAVTNPKIADGAVDTEHIADDAIEANHISAGSIEAAAMAVNSVGTTAIQTDSVGTSELAPDAVTENEIADDAVKSNHIFDGAILTAAIADDQVTRAKLSFELDSGAHVGNTGASGEVAVSFGITFATAPKVFVQVADNLNQYAIVNFGVAPPTTTGFLVVIHDGDTGSAVGVQATRFNWFAISDL